MLRQPKNKSVLISMKELNDEESEMGAQIDNEIWKDQETKVVQMELPTPKILSRSISLQSFEEREEDFEADQNASPRYLSDRS
jgi:hypothetical protein